MKFVKRGLFFIVLSYLFVLTLLFFAQKNLIFFPQILDKSAILSLPEGYQERFLTLSSDSEVSIHYIAYEVPKPKRVILYFHGNAGALDSWGNIASELSKRTHSHVVMMDYPGFGKSGGSLPSSDDVLKKMAEDFFNLCQKSYTGLPIYLYGRSIGSGIAGYLAKEHKVGGLIWETPYTSLKAMALEMFPWVPSFVLRFDFDNLGVASANPDFPILILHGTNDEVIPFAHGKALSGSLPKSLFVPIPGGHHNDLERFPEFWANLEAFLPVN